VNRYEQRIAAAYTFLREHWPRATPPLSSVHERAVAEVLVTLAIVLEREVNHFKSDEPPIGIGAR
jgi:hypothetical protein